MLELREIWKYKEDGARMFEDAGRLEIIKTRPIIVNPAHIRTARPAAFGAIVTLSNGDSLRVTNPFDILRRELLAWEGVDNA